MALCHIQAKKKKKKLCKLQKNRGTKERPSLLYKEQKINQDGFWEGAYSLRETINLKSIFPVAFRKLLYKSRDSR